MNECVIFGAGEYGGGFPLYDSANFYIAADNGLCAMLKCGIKPDLIIGDFDSLSVPLPEDAPVLRLPVQKDVTDSHAAVSEGIKRGYTSFHIFGALGGRLDHSMANISLCAGLSQKGISCKLHGRDCIVTAITDGEMRFDSGMKGTVSVFSWTDISLGVFEKGLQYELNDAKLTNSFALGVSNSFTGKDAKISVRKGTLILMYEI